LWQSAKTIFMALVSKLRIIFMGTPDFSVPALIALKAAGHEIIAVYCQPPKPAGRGRQVQKSAVQRAAEEMGLALRTPKTLRDADEQTYFKALAGDIAVVVAYGLILPKPVLDAPKLGCLNIHASLLPRWRGAAPIQRAMLAGDIETGITIMQMEEGLDTGPILLQEKCPISTLTKAGYLHDELSQMGARLIVRALEGISSRGLKPLPQPDTGVTYASKLTREDGRINWHKPATEIERQVRALQPWPGCFFILGNDPIKLLAAEVVKKTAPPGRLIGDDFTVACGADALRLITLQRAGKNPVDGPSFLRGLRLPVGYGL